ncbi:hypothetical protein D9C73_016782 [Collichthys lucidus]|uniref:Uncharacterized protein n=1 Tax=Collichthys lucidus TaxID=240159 RepID=A0A4U5V4E5_COLLU|nr:hypothetical protein D9C73_016782 [Collichthys lucidus]
MEARGGLTSSCGPPSVQEDVKKPRSREAVARIPGPRGWSATAGPSLLPSLSIGRMMERNGLGRRRENSDRVLFVLLGESEPEQDSCGPENQNKELKEAKTQQSCDRFGETRWFNVEKQKHNNF